MKKIIFISILFSLVGCDVPGIIRLENASGGNAIYITHQQGLNSVIDTVKIEIADQSKKEIILGFGQRWTDDGIRKYLSEINQIEIVTEDETMALSDKQKIYQYFRKRRKGLFKQILKIKIE
jgi:hypothetical protein